MPDQQDPARAVLNQPPPLEPVNLFELDLALQEALAREGGGWGIERVREAGRRRRQRRGARARPPRRAQRAGAANPRPLRQPDRCRSSSIPSWHWLLRGAIERGIVGPALARAAARRARRPRRAVHALGPARRRRHVPGLDDLCRGAGAARRLAPSSPPSGSRGSPPTTTTRGALAGMAMTERQGGSDVRANITRRDEVGDGWYELHGHKWFCSYPPCDVFLVLAQTPAGLSCFLVERGPGHGVPAAQGQARDALAAERRGRVPRRPRAAARRGGARRADDHPHGQPHPP